MDRQIVRARAPLRISFAGGGTEISPYVEEYGGLVLNATLGMHALVTIENSDDENIHFCAKDTGTSLSFASCAELPTNNELKLHCAVYNHMVQTYAGSKPLPIRVTTFCDAPPGSGLGSSSTLTVAMLGAFDRYLRLHLDQYQIAGLAFDIERIKLGLKGGRQDQYAASFGGFNLIEFNSNGSVLVNSLRIAPKNIQELESSLILYFTGRSRESADIIAAQARNLTAGKSETIESLHMIKELVSEMRHSLVSGNIPRLGDLLHQSWVMKKKTASNVSNQTIDDLYDAARNAGAIGGKITGAGGGGFMMLVADPTLRPDVISVLKSHGGYILPTSFVQDGVNAWALSRNNSMLQA